MAIEALRDMQKNPAAAVARCSERIKFIRDSYLWAGRAKEWAAWLAQLAGGEAEPADAEA